LNLRRRHGDARHLPGVAAANEAAAYAKIGRYFRTSVLDAMQMRWYIVVPIGIEYWTT
jgi:hypothetical protein